MPSCQRRNYKMQKKLSYYVFLMVVLSYVRGQGKSSKNRILSRCPRKCSCTNWSVKCVNKFIKEVPSNLSESIFSLDLSKNPNLQITVKSFEKFTNLAWLKLESCNLHVAFRVSNKVRGIYLKTNKLTYQQFYTMFFRSSPFLRYVDVSNNNIHIITGKPLLNTKTLKLSFLDMEGNHMRTIYNQTFHGFNHLRTLRLKNMGVETIEKDAFRDLSNLEYLDLMYNKLCKLPENLFRPLRKLTTLTLESNKLQELPDLRGLPTNMQKLDIGKNSLTNISSLSEMGIHSVGILKLWYNKITSLPKHIFQKISAVEINLAFNKIKEIEDYSFTACASLPYLLLDSNDIVSMSEKAFNGVHFISLLSLSGNKLTFLPAGIFTNLQIDWIFLHNNNISSIDNTWRNIKKAPKVILLFYNPITKLSIDSLNGLASHTKVYISCNMLSQISEIRSMGPVILCGQSVSLYFVFPWSWFWSWLEALLYVLGHSGFDCKRNIDEAAYGGQLNCTTCPLGHYKGNESPCRPCPPGSFYQDKLLQTKCKRCRKGQYVSLENAPGKGPLDCRTCPEGTQSDRSAEHRACFCLPGFARLNRFGPCTKCTAKGISCEKDYRILEQGFWWSWEYNITCKAKYQAFIDNLETFDDSYSRQTYSFSCKIPQPFKCPNKDACLGTVDSSCHKNYTGPLCELCRKNYYRHFRMCLRCPRKWVAALKLFAYFVVFIIVCIVVNWADKNMVDTEDATLVPMNMTKAVKRKQRTVADIILSTLKILLGFYQVLNGTVNSLPSIQWPDSLTKALQVFRYIELEFLHIPSLRCIKPEWRLSAVDEFWLSLGITFLVPLIIGVYYLIRKIFLNKTVRTYRAYTESIETCKKQCMRSIILFLFATFPSTSRNIFQILPVACHKLCLTASGHCFSYLRADYSIKCLSSSTETYRILYLAYVSLIIPFGFVVFLLLSLACITHCKQDHRSYEMSNGDLCASDVQHENLNIELIRCDLINQDIHESTLQFALKFCYENYRPSCWYWEITEMLRKLFFTSILPLLTPFSNIFLGFSIIFAGFFALLHAYKKPIQDSFEHWLQMISLSVIPANLCIAYILHTIATQRFSIFDVKEEKLGISVILILLNSALVIIVILRYMRTQIRKMKQLWGKHQCGFKCCVACILPCAEPEEDQDRGVHNTF